MHCVVLSCFLVFRSRLKKANAAAAERRRAEGRGRQLRARIREQVVEAGHSPWREQLARLVEITCAADGDAAFFDTDMHYLEARIAAPEHHQRSFDALADVWCDAVAGWDDLVPQPAPERVRMLIFLVWSAMRYRLLADPVKTEEALWLAEIREICERTLAPA